MWDKKEIENSVSTIRKLIAENRIIKPETGREQFFLDKSINSFNLAKQINLEQNNFMWIVTIDEMLWFAIL